MNGKTKFLIIGLLLVLALSFFLGHFWSCTIYALQKAVAEGLVPSLVFFKLGTGLMGAHFLL